MIQEYQLRILPEIAANEQKLKEYLSKEKGLNLRDITATRILKRSIDARQRTIFVNLKVRAYIREMPKDDEYEHTIYNKVEGKPQVIVVGAGPGGLFAALRLIELGLRPVVIERGKDVRERKKDLAQIAMAYEHVYVAQVAMGANPVQTIKAFKEAEAYNGPSLIIAYSPCMEHGIKGGLANHQKQQKDAVACGYFNLLRYDPRLEDEGKNPLQIDSKEPDFDKFKDFLLSENRFAQLSKINPEHADELMDKCLNDAKKRRERLNRMI